MLRSKLLLPGLALALAGTAAAQNGTDACTTPTAVGEGTFAFDTTTMVTNDDLTGCNSNLFGAGPYFYNDMYWVYTATIAGDIVIDTEGSSYDTQLAVHTGVDCAAICLDNDDDSGAGGTGYQSKLTIPAVNIGDQFVVQVGGYGGSGVGTLNISLAPPLNPNNDCGLAAPITGTGAFPYDSSGATSSGFDGGGTCAAGSNTINQDIFFQWTAPAMGDFQFDTLGTSYDTKLSVHAGTGCLAVCAGYNDDVNYPTIPQSSVSLLGVNMGDTFLIQVGGYAAADVGPGVLTISNFFDPCATAVDDAFEDNDTCLTPTVLAAGTYPGLWVSNTDSDFYEITVPAFEIGTVLLTQINGDTDFNIYDASCTLLGNVAGSFTWTNVTGAPETIIVEAVNYVLSPSTCSDYDLDVSSAPDVCQGPGIDDSFEDNDDCANAAPIADGTYPSLFVWRFDSDHYSMCVADGATLDVDMLFSNAAGDLDMFLWEAVDPNCGSGFGTTELALGFSGDDNETLSWTNTTGSDIDLVLEVNVYGGSASACNSYDLTISGAGCGSPVVGVPFCDPANNNSTGVPAVLTGSWGSGVGSDLHLEMNDGVPGQLAYMLVGNEPTIGFTIMGANGPLCLVGTPTAVFYRYNVPGPMNSIGGFDASATWINVSGTSTTGFGFDVPTMVPAAVPFAIMAGDTWHFQGWYRDTPAGSGQSNFTNGLSVTF